MNFGSIIVLLTLFYSISSSSIAKDMWKDLGISLYDDLPNMTNVMSDEDLAKNVKFLLYTPNNTDKAQRLMLDDKYGLMKSSYNSNFPTKFVTHGWMSNSSSGAIQLIKEGFFIRGSFNVIAVDWGTLAYNPTYVIPAAQVDDVGKYVAKMVDYMVSQGSNRDNITLIGHSLGAHVMGIAGYNLAVKVPHIVGLDPAGPGYGLRDESSRISPKDAKLVEIIHTNAGLLGLPWPVGHADFYPNGGGIIQPGCGLDVTGVCSHTRSYEYYAESLRLPNKWLAIRCGSYEDFLASICRESAIVPFPRWIPIPKPHAVYALQTNDTSPYGLGENGTKASPDTALTFSKVAVQRKVNIPSNY